MMGLRAPAAARPAMMVAVAPVPRRTLVVVAAAGDAAEKKKRLPQPVKRAQQAVERRMVNKSRKSATATRIKKVRGRRSCFFGWRTRCTRQGALAGARAMPFNAALARLWARGRG